MKFGLIAGEVYGEHNGVGLVGISNTVATQNDFFFGTEPFDGVQRRTCVIQGNSDHKQSGPVHAQNTKW